MTDGEDLARQAEALAKEARELANNAEAKPLGKIAKKLEYLAVILGWWFATWLIRWGCGE